MVSTVVAAGRRQTKRDLVGRRSIHQAYESASGAPVAACQHHGGTRCGAQATKEGVTSLLPIPLLQRGQPWESVCL